MSIDTNHFEASASGRRVCQVLTKGRMAPESFLHLVLQAVVEILPALQANVTYSTEDLCGPELWVHWLTGERRSAGMCIRYLIENHELPLALVSRAGKYPLRFCLNS